MADIDVPFARALSPSLPLSEVAASVPRRSPPHEFEPDALVPILGGRVVYALHDSFSVRIGKSDPIPL